MGKLISKREWYQLLDDYSALLNQRIEYGIFFSKENELIQLQSKLLQQESLMNFEIMKIIGDGEYTSESISIFSNKLDALFNKIRELEPITKEDYSKSYIKAGLLFCGEKLEIIDSLKFAVIVFVFMFLILKTFRLL